MLAEIGYGIIVVAFVVALYSVAAAVYGERRKSLAVVESARRAMLLLWPLISLSAGCLIFLLVTNHFEVSFVYEVTSRDMPTYLKITAWWGGQAGSLVFWSWLMAAFASLVTLRKWDRDREFLPWVIVVTSITTAFFLGLVVFYENPFARFWQTPDGQVITSMFAPLNAVAMLPPDGRGLNPLLRHPGMIIHPPMLYLGFVSFVIPYAFAMAALITGRTDDRWIRLTRRWTLWAWLFLSFGLVLGSRWAYDVLGWGGFWGWDPVEIAALMPWLTGTAFLHSVVIQEKRGLFKQWNMILIILTYALVIFGTFLTRSGVLSSVHAFAQSAIGPAFFGFIGVTFITSIALLIYRWPDLHDETELKSMLSREALFLFNNALFMAVLVVCFAGVIWPLLSELITGQKVTVGPPFYQFANAPLFALLMLLMGLAPLSSWGLSSSERLAHNRWPVLAAIAAVPTLLFIAFWRPLTAMLGGVPAVVILLAVIIVGLLLLYFFRQRVWQATIASVVIVGYLFATYTHNVVALLGFFLVALVLLVTIREFWRAASARAKAQGENIGVALWKLFGRDRRRYGGYVIHVSMMLMAIGIMGINMFQQETQGTLPVNGDLKLGEYTVKYESIAQFNAQDNRQVTRAVVGVYDNQGNYLGELHPRIDYFPDAQQNMTIPGERATMRDDLYVLLVDWEPATSTGATFKIFVNPLVNWLWLGSLVFLLGILIAAWPSREAARLPEVLGRPATQPEGQRTSAAD